MDGIPDNVVALRNIQRIKITGIAIVFKHNREWAFWGGTLDFNRVPNMELLLSDDVYRHNGRISCLKKMDKLFEVPGLPRVSPS